jgi:hypothetical protein
VVLTTLAVIIGLNVWRLVMARVAQAPGAIGSLGVALGGLAHFG